MIPKINQLNENRLASMEFLRTNRDRFAEVQKAAVLRCSGFYISFLMESLILAQDERLRRA